MIFVTKCSGRCPTRTRPIPNNLLRDDGPFRQYVALDGEEIVGRVRSVNAAGATWCADMYVRPSHRRRGIGQALLAELRRRLEQPLRANADWLVRLEREGTSFIHTLATRVSEHELDRAKQSDLTEALRGLDSELQAARVELERRSSDACAA